MGIGGIINLAPARCRGCTPLSTHTRSLLGLGADTLTYLADASLVERQQVQGAVAGQAVVLGGGDRKGVVVEGAELDLNVKQSTQRGRDVNTRHTAIP